MYNLYFMQIIEKNMPKILKQAEHLMKLEMAQDRINEKIKIVNDKRNKITDVNSQESQDALNQLMDLYSKSGEIEKAMYDAAAPINNLITDIEADLRNNKAILEKYKDVEDDKTIDGWKIYLKQHDIKPIELEKKLKAIQRKLDLNNLTKEEIAKLDPQAKNEALEARREYLNNKKEYEYYEKLKYVTLLGDKTAEKRIYETELAIEYMSKDDPELDEYVAPERMKKIISRLEVLLDIEKQEPKVKFDLKTHTYTYVDARGKETKIDDLFEKQEKGRYKSRLTKEQIESLKKYAKAQGLSRRQMKAIDYNVLMTLFKMNPDAVDKYLKGELSTEYDLRQKGVEKENQIKFKDLFKITRAAIKQKAMGLATVIQDKSRWKIVGLLTAAGVLALGGATAHTVLNEVKDAKINAEKEVDLPEDKKDEPKINGNQWEWNNNQDKNKKDEPKINGNQWEWNNDQDKDKKDEPKINGNQWEWNNNQDKNESTIEITVPEEDRDEIQNVINEAMKQYYNKEQQTDSKQQKTTKQSKNSGTKKGDKTKEKGDKEVVIDARGKVTIVEDKEEENGEVIIVDDVEKEDGEVIIVDDGEENVITSDEDMTFKERLQRMAVMEHDLEDYHYENYERAVEESQQRHEEMIEAIEDQIAIDEEEGR